MSKQEFLRKELEENIKWFGRESTKHKNMHRRFRYAVYGLTAVSTILAGLPVAFPEMQTPVSLLMLLSTGGLGVVNAVESLRRAPELWIHERSLFYALKDIERRLEYHSADQELSSNVDQLFLEMQDVLQSGRDRWNQMISGRGLRSSQQSQPGAPGVAAG